MDWLGNLLFRNQPRALRRKRMREFAVTVAIVVVVCALIGIGLYAYYKQKRP